MFKKKYAAAFLAGIIGISMLAGCKGETDAEVTSVTDGSSVTEETEKIEDVEILNFKMPEIGEKIAVMTVKDFGTIKIKLFADVADKGTENFIGLSEMGYYDELIFHRIIPNFMNQGGDPRGDGTGGKSFWGEQFDGGTPEGLYHFSGAIAYANSGSTSTNGSQFYIVNTPADYVYYGGYYDENQQLQMYSDFESSGISLPQNVKDKYLEVGGVPFLDGGYTVFGQVFEGLDVVRAMSAVETDEDDKPLSQVLIESVKIEEYQG